MKSLFKLGSFLALFNFSVLCVSSQTIPFFLLIPHSGDMFDDTRDGAAVLKDGRHLHGKFYYSSPAFSSDDVFYFYKDGDRHKREKIKISEVREANFRGEKSGRNFYFVNKNNALEYTDPAGKRLVLNGSILRHLE